MAESILSLTIFVNDAENKICFFKGAKDHGSNAVATYQSNAMDRSFFSEFARILNLYKKKFGQKTVSNVSLLLPDHLFLTDMITVPNMGKKAAENSLGLVIDTVYQNRSDLTYNTFLLQQTKQTEMYGLVGARKDLLQDFRDTCAENGFNLQNITFVSNAMADGAMAVNANLRTATCLLLDIKESCARFAFLNKGRTLGTFTLPFGYSVLSPTELVNEKQLFDYFSAKQLVRNATEKARAKTTLTDEDIFAFPEEDAVPEKPQLLHRSTPTDRNGFLLENFRIFVKWTLELLAANAKISALGKIDTVYVNMPAEYQFLLGEVNLESDENGVFFQPMFTDGAAPKILEMLGGLQVKQYNRLNNF